MDILFDVFVYNFLVISLLEYSLQLTIFAMVNIWQVNLNLHLKYFQTDKLETFSEIFSYTLSSLFLSVFTGLALAIIYLVNKHPNKQATLAQAYPKIQAVFHLYRADSKWGQSYYAVFLIRRMLIGAILVFIQNGPFQVYTLIFVSLGAVTYMISVKPFEDPFLNRLETFNEAIILICSYHLLFFSEANPDFKLKY